MWIGKRGGQPSIVTPTPPPWDSPNVLILKSFPIVFPVPKSFVACRTDFVEVDDSGMVKEVMDVRSREIRMRRRIVDGICVEVDFDMIKDMRSIQFWRLNC